MEVPQRYPSCLSPRPASMAHSSRLPVSQNLLPSNHLESINSRRSSSNSK